MTHALLTRLETLPLPPSERAALRAAVARMSPQELQAWGAAMDAWRRDARSPSKILALLSARGQAARRQGLEILGGVADPAIWDAVLEGVGLSERGLTGPHAPSQELLMALLTRPNARPFRLRRLRLRGGWLEALPALLDLPARLPRLESLEIIGARRLRDLGGLGAHPRLRAVSIERCSAMTDLSPLGALPALAALAIDLEPLPAAEGLRAPFDGWTPGPSLRELALQGSSAWGARTEITLRGLVAPELERLSLRHVHRVVGLDALAEALAAGGTGALQSLSIDGAGLEALAAPGPLLRLPALRAVSVRGEALDDGALARLRRRAALEAADPADGSRAAALLGVASDTTSLEIPGELAVRRLTGLRHLPALESLAVRAGGRGDQLRLQTLDGLRGCPSLREVAVTFRRRVRSSPRNDLRDVGALVALDHLERLRIDFARSVGVLPTAADLRYPLKGSPWRRVPYIELSTRESVLRYQIRLAAASSDPDAPERLAALVARWEAAAGRPMASLDLSQIPGLRDLQNLRALDGPRELSVAGCQDLISLEGIESVGSLRALRAGDCPRLDLAGIALARGLQALDLSRSPALRDLGAIAPIAAGLAALRVVDLSYCKALTSVAGLRACPELEKIRLGRCEAMDTRTLGTPRAIQRYFASE